MKKFGIVTLAIVAILGITIVLASMSASDTVESSLFTDAATTAAGATSTRTIQPSPTPFSVATPTATSPAGTIGGATRPITASSSVPVNISLDIDQGGRFLLADGSSRNVKLIDTELIYSVDGLTIWGTATVEVSGPDLPPIQKEVSVSFFHRPTIIYDVRIWVAMTKYFNDGNLRDGGPSSLDARLVLSDARLPLTDPEAYVWPYGDLVWQEGAANTFYQGLQGNLGTGAFHHGAIDLGMPSGTPVYAWTDGTANLTDRGFDFKANIGNTKDGQFREMEILHLSSVVDDLDGTQVEKGTLIGYSGSANWYHTHIVNVSSLGYAMGPIVAEWYMNSATPERLSYVKDWIVAGPFFNEDDGLRLHEDYLSGEETVEPEFEQSAADGRDWLYWDNIVPGVVMAAETVSAFPYSGLTHVEENFPMGSLYMATYVNSPEPMDVVLNVGASDAVKVWVGDELVIEEDSCVPQTTARLGQELTIFVDQLKIPVSLDAGWNRVLVKTSQRDGCPESWQVSLRFSDEAGRVVDGLVSDPLKGGTPPDPQARPNEKQAVLMGIDPATFGIPSVRTTGG